MSRCNYNSKRLIPAPQVQFSKSYFTSDDGTKIGSAWSIQISGTIVAFKGSPTSAGVFHAVSGFPADETVAENQRLGSILRKQQAIRDLFSEDGHSLEWQSEDGTSPIKCNPRVTAIEFQQGIWYDRCEYTISLTAPTLYSSGLPVGEDANLSQIESASESWSIEASDEPVSVGINRTYRVGHTVTAKGSRLYDNSGGSTAGYVQAKTWVVARLGMDTSILAASVVGSLSGLGRYNSLRSENIDEVAGSYSVTESWVLSASAATETFDINTTTSLADGLTRVTVDGTITGYDSPSTSKYANAITKYASVNPFSLATAYGGGANLKSVPVSTSVAKNPITGVIRYTNEYDNRPNNLIAGARTESITISDSMPTQFVVPIFVLGRAAGPVLQNLNTSREKRRTVNIEVVMTLPAGGVFASSPRGECEGIANQHRPQGTAFEDENNDSWDMKNGRYTFTRSWIWE